MSRVAPNVVVVAGPNGSGKSTAAPALLRDYLGIVEFVNADTIAQGLSGFGAEAMAGLHRFFRLYRPLVDSWAMFDNSGGQGYELIAAQTKSATISVANHRFGSPSRSNTHDSGSGPCHGHRALE